MKIKKDILGNTPQIGDTIAFNPSHYKGLLTGEVLGFTSSGSPEINPKNVYPHMQHIGDANKNGMYTPKTGFVIVK